MYLSFSLAIPYLNSPLLELIPIDLNLFASTRREKSLDIEGIYLNAFSLSKGRLNNSVSKSSTNDSTFPIPYLFEASLFYPL